jgi:hypothetical protein
MNQLRDPDAIIAAWLEDGPNDLSADARRAIVTGMRVVSRRRPGPVFGGTPMTTFMRLAAAAFVVVVAVISLSVLVPGGGSTPGGVVASPSPTASPTSSLGPTPSASPSIDPRTPSPLDGVASEFPHPFSYRLLDNAGLVVSVTEPSFYQFRVPASDPPDSWGNGIVVRRITGGRSNPCSEASPIVPISGGPATVVNYLRGSPLLIVGNDVPISVSGMPAVRVTIAPKGPRAECSDLWLWAEEGSFTQNAGWNSSAELTIVDVAGDHVVIMAIGDTAWQSASRTFVDSIRFE